MDSDLENESNSSECSSDSLSYSVLSSSSSDCNRNNPEYKCIRCENSTNISLEPFTLQHLAVTAIFRQLWPLSIQRKREIRESEYFKILDTIIIRTEVKNFLFYLITKYGAKVVNVSKLRWLIEDNKWLSVDEAIISRHNGSNFIPYCCCTFQRRTLIYPCCFYNWSLETSGHCGTSDTHCCRGNFDQQCEYYREVRAYENALWQFDSVNDTTMKYSIYSKFLKAVLQPYGDER